MILKISSAQLLCTVLSYTMVPHMCVPYILRQPCLSGCMHTLNGNGDGERQKLQKGCAHYCISQDAVLDLRPLVWLTKRSSAAFSRWRSLRYNPLYRTVASATHVITVILRAWAYLSAKVLVTEVW